MPLFFRLKSKLLPPLNLPSSTCLIAVKTPLSTRFTPEVRTRLASLYWSLSTPMPQMPAASAALSVPSPQPPATWKSTCTPCEIWFSATVLHLSEATKSWE
jgi:hypothetical protein